jgi:iron-sulfur cluster protein
LSKLDPYLAKVLKDFSISYLIKRQNAFEYLDFETLRTQLAAAKDRTIDQLEGYLKQFEEQAKNHGSQVLYARDGEEANRLILEILKKHGARKLVKSKSMVSEEIELNEFLTKQGIEPRETDLGEWIVQLDQERPTHMVMPAIHLTRKEVAGIFSRHLGKEVPEEIPALVRIAREELRREIFSAPAGLSGANALIAENGAIMLVTNEGNGRLVSTIPPVHIVLASIEKVLPSAQDAFLLLKLLPRNATGQAITSYVSFIAGPHKEAQYIILLDNHRSRILTDQKFKEILRCIKCSACLNVCPVYQTLGGKEFSHIYMGGIGALLTAWIHGLRQSKKLAGLCLGCHRCEEYCATKIKIADLILALRERLNEELGKPFWKRLAFEGVMGHSKFHRNAFLLAGKARPIISERDGFLRNLPLFLKKYDRFRSLPAPASKSLSQLFKKSFPPEKAEKAQGNVVLYPGCLVEHFYPEIGIAASKVLRALDYQVELAPALCCGFPSANGGFNLASRRAYKKLITNLDDSNYVITLCPTCATMLTQIGPKLLDSEKADNLAKKVFPFSHFLFEKERQKCSKLFPFQASTLCVTYHESCHHKYLLKAADASKRMVQMALGKEILEMSSPEACCGFAGSFSVDHPEISEALLEGKLASIKNSGAEIVALDCPGCLLQIRGGCHRQGYPIAVKHTAELLAERLKN